MDIPLHILIMVNGVAGSGEGSLIRDVFAKQYGDRIILVDRTPIIATSRSTPITFLDFSDDIRKLMASEHHIGVNMFSLNSKGACPHYHEKGIAIAELVPMGPATTVCEMYRGKRYSGETLSYKYRGRSIADITELIVEDALEFFNDKPRIFRELRTLHGVGLSYLSLGQPLSALSDDKRQRIKLAKHLKNKGNIFTLDEPATSLHASDIKGIIKLLEGFVGQGNTVIIIEHNLDVMKRVDYIIDIGSDGGTAGGEVVFMGTPK